jgi:hypothetical protein
MEVDGLLFYTCPGVMQPELEWVLPDGLGRYGVDHVSHTCLLAIHTTTAITNCQQTKE